MHMLNNVSLSERKNEMKMRKPIALLLSLCLLLSLAACSPASSSSSSAAETVQESAPDETGAVQTDETAAESSVTETSAESSASVTVTDHADRTVTVPTNPERVVILDILPLPSVLTVFLGSAESILAMQPASMNAAKNGILSQLYPEVLNVSTDIMSGDDVNVEALVALDPQIVYYNAANAALLEKLENAGLTAVAVSPTKWKYDCIVTYDNWIALLSQIYPDAGSELAGKVHDFSTSKYDLIQERVAGMDEADKKKVLFLFQYDENTMITSGSSFFGQWWCDASGAINAANEVAADNSNAAITMEQVYEWDPDVIIITNFTPTQPEDLMSNNIGSDDWSTVSAVKNDQVYKMPLGTYRTYTPGVDTPMTLEWMASILYPELFPEFKLTEDVRSYYSDLYGVELSDEQIEAMYNPAGAAGSWR